MKSCAIEGCEKPGPYVRTFCPMHYRRLRVHGDPSVSWAMRGKVCSVDGCESPQRAQTYCTLHYQRFKANGTTDYVGRITLAEQGRIPHGTPQGYNFHKCRCEACLGWFRPYSREAMLNKYGITTTDFNRMFEEQGGVCAICSEPEPNGKNLNVDHCHETGRVRALLCGNCNRGIGHLRDDPDRLMAAAAYLLQFTDVLAEETR